MLFGWFGGGRYRFFKLVRTTEKPSGEAGKRRSRQGRKRVGERGDFNWVRCYWFLVLRVVPGHNGRSICIMHPGRGWEGKLENIPVTFSNMADRRGGKNNVSWASAPQARVALSNNELCAGLLLPLPLPKLGRLVRKWSN